MNKTYTNGEISVLWQPEKCWHAAACVQNLPSVFDVKRRPWVDMTGATTQEITRVVDLCPSGALTYTRNDGKE